MTEEASAFYTVVILTMIFGAWLLSLVPSCGHEDCKKAHQRHSIAERAEAIKVETERLHAFHDRFRPQASCYLCQKPPDEP